MFTHTHPLTPRLSLPICFSISFPLSNSPSSFWAPFIPPPLPPPPSPPSPSAQDNRLCYDAHSYVSRGPFAHTSIHRGSVKPGAQTQAAARYLLPEITDTTRLLYQQLGWQSCIPSQKRLLLPSQTDVIKKDYSYSPFNKWVWFSLCLKLNVTCLLWSRKKALWVSGTSWKIHCVT